MKYLIGLVSVLLLGCASKKVQDIPEAPRGLYEVLTQQSTGGANIRFFEILTTTDEIAMLRGDENLRGKISDSDMETANFLILNMGEKPTGGYSINVTNVEETPTNIIVTVVENNPEAGSMNTMAITYPYTVVRINSKKPIEIK